MNSPMAQVVKTTIRVKKSQFTQLNMFDLFAAKLYEHLINNTIPLSPVGRAMVL